MARQQKEHKQLAESESPQELHCPFYPGVSAHWHFYAHRPANGEPQALAPTTARTTSHLHAHIVDAASIQIISTAHSTRSMTNLCAYIETPAPFVASSDQKTHQPHILHKLLWHTFRTRTSSMRKMKAHRNSYARFNLASQRIGTSMPNRSAHGEPQHPHSRKPQRRTPSCPITYATDATRADHHL